MKLTTCAAQCLPNQKDIETPSGHRLVHLGRIHFCNANIVEVCDGIFFELLFNLQIHEGFFHFRHSGTDRFMIEWLYSRPLSSRPQAKPSLARRHSPRVQLVEPPQLQISNRPKFLPPSHPCRRCSATVGVRAGVNVKRHGWHLRMFELW